ncbi:MAG: aldehyde:ferredoxin oxidoreductase [Chloroflexi bacterium]|nr:MAG: aldehyde:ferredoxin oxidoreductase [Anaerolineaceae bacterium 4572_32.2]RLC71644.1 MAG: aldehyde:ferredoxin oxidoreductase [Chloroflexota bacterium]RLC87784.1 MAG: aldehyde:ferredoxin oxidoreductase [Chloroflexota bacterium]HEY72548.1 aldehyde ferredoxin oxidoreductase family protein [Thermoflexia bacterium]
MHGFYNRFLRVDLSTQTWAAEDIPDEILIRYLGGKGLAAHLLLENAPTGVEPLASENPLIFATGPATGTTLAPASRYGVFTKSPLTGIFSESYSGGHTAPQIKATGYDAILLQGAADTPVYLEISDHEVVFHDGAPFWGLDTYQAEEALEADVGVRGAKVIVIGPAGERRIPFAVIGNDRGRQAGRTGVGAVMGSKRLKGIAFHGQTECPLHDAGAIKAYDRQLRERGKDNAGAQAYRKFGTPMVVAIANKFGSFPSYYWSAGTVPHWEQISAEALVERFKPRSTACYRCFLACGKLTTVPDGRHAGLTLEGPEYETIFAFGGLCAVDDLAEIVYLNDICNRLGLDTITAGNVVGFAIEASHRGVLDLELDYGDVDGIAELLRQIGRREGIGELLSQGVRAASQELGLEELAIHVKGLEPAGYDPRALKGMGLAYAVSDRGACHLRATVYKAEFAGWVDRTSAEGKAETVLDFEDRHTLFDTLILCRFYRDMIGWDDLSAVIRGLTGLELDKAGLQALSARIADNIRRFNLREGMTPADDTLPKRFLQEPLEPSGETLSEAELEQMLGEYYALRGWKRA